MDYFGIPRGSIRAQAFKKLAKTTLETVSTDKIEGSATQANFPKLLRETFDEDDQHNGSAFLPSNGKNKLSKVAITLREFEVLVALCEATLPKIQSLDHAKILLQKFRMYLVELPDQKFSASILSKLNGINSSPWLILAEKLTTAIVNIAVQFEDKYLLTPALDILQEFITELFKIKEHVNANGDLNGIASGGFPEEDASLEHYQMSHYLSLLGYIRALIKNSEILTLSRDSFNVFISLDSKIDNPRFLKGVEIYSNKNFSTLHDHEFAMEFSPILYIESMSKLMCSIASSILRIDQDEESLMEHILNKVSSSVGEQNNTDEVNGTLTNGGIKEESASLDISSRHMKIIKILSDIAIQKMDFLDRGETYVVYSTFSRFRIGLLAKSYNLQIIGCGMFTDNLEFKMAKKIFKNCLQIYDVMLDSNLGPSVLQLGALSVFKDDRIGSSLTRSFTSLVSNPEFSKEYCRKSSKSVGLASRALTQDAVYTTIYTLTNLLFVGNDIQSRNFKRNNTGGLNSSASRDAMNLSRIPSSTSFDFRDGTNSISNDGNITSDNIYYPDGNKPIANSGNDYSDSEYAKVCENAIIAISEITQASRDESVTTLAVTILSQKLTKIDNEVTITLLNGLVSCAPYLPEREFLILMRLLNRMSLEAMESKKWKMYEGIIEAKVNLSLNLKKKRNEPNSLYWVYLKDILQSIISKGDVQVLEHHRSHVEINEIGEQIGVYLRPLASLLPNIELDEPKLELRDTNIINLFRNIWFNMVVHGYSINSKFAEKYNVELKAIVYNTPPLASELSWDHTETSLEMNTVLRRGSSNHNVKDHKHIIGDIFDFPRSITYPKLMFLSATVFVESLRVKSCGECSTILEYFSDPSIKTTGIDKYIGHIAFQIVKDYIFLIGCGANKLFTSASIAQQLTNMLTLCCHRMEELQDAALQCCDLLINKVPSALCNSKSLFSVFDILTLLFQSLIDADKNQYEPTTTYTAPKNSGIQLSLSDSYKWRNETFNRFHEKSKNWVKLVLLKANDEAKSLIQSYVSDMDTFQNNKNLQFGVLFSLEMAGLILSNDRELSNLSQISTTRFNTLPIFLSQFSWRLSFISALSDKVDTYTSEYVENAFNNVRGRIQELNLRINRGKKAYSTKEIIDLLTDCAGLILISDSNNAEMIRHLVRIPFEIFEEELMIAAISIWYSVMKDHKNLSILIMSEIFKHWETSIELRKGIFSSARDLTKPEFSVMEYAPSDKKSINNASRVTSKEFEPHLLIIKLVSSNFETSLNQSDHLLKLFTRFIEVGLSNLTISASFHPFARLARFELIRFSLKVLNYHVKLGSRSVQSLTMLILDASLSWFKGRTIFPYGHNALKIKADYYILKEVAKLISQLDTFKSESFELKLILLMFFLDDEISKISVWLQPLDPQDTRGSYISNHINEKNITKAYQIDPILAINLSLRYKVKNLDEMLQNLISSNPLAAIFYPEAVQYFIGINAGTNMPSYQLLFWEPLSPIDSITLFLPPFGNNPYILQYTMRSLESHDVNLTFFYVPQIVQSLRFDAKGYVERFILETAKVSQLFAHQIIWNMLANSYKDEDSTIADLLKPTLDKIQHLMIKSFSPEDLSFYRKEFEFFNEVTAISGKLKPFIKNTKAEKKVKIDEEMAKIEVEKGVYLPSNPDGVVIDINRKSGKPLQSHAKAPFLATFKIRKEIETISDNGELTRSTIEKWQSAIFKVGDDCRQDVLALQLISVFRTIWANAGLDLYVFPYRVTATAPGCGVIDVLPNSVSRDMLGREAVNGLYEYFTTKFGPETSIEFQQARNNLIKSLAAYSIISYLLQFKDRHNGNIMYDEQGHILHIDFGFCFDIVPGGVKFEVAPFKLTHEMILVLGGNSQTQAFQWFEELCVKGYLACRPYMETIVRCVNPMLESGLPCFKDTTIKKLRSRFVPTKSEKEASIHMKGLVKKAMESYYTKGYDEFQRLTNGIPY